MKLLTQLDLKDATTVDVSMTPTKRFFKPVVVFEAPITREAAAILESAHLFDGRGNPHPFDGRYTLHGELAADLVLQTKLGADIEIKTEKVARVAFFRQEKKGMFLSMRVHLPEGEDQLLALLHKLAELNKEGFRLTLRPHQKPLILVDDKAGPGDPSYKHKEADPATGAYDTDQATKRPFRQGPVSAEAYTLDVEGGFVSGWQLRARFKRGDVIAGEVPGKESQVWLSENDALSSALDGLWAAMRKEAGVASDSKEKKAWSALEAWIMDMHPEHRPNKDTIQ